MFKPDRPPRHRLIPPDWFVSMWNQNHPGEYRTALDPLLMDLWLLLSTRPVPSPLAITAGS